MPAVTSPFDRASIPSTPSPFPSPSSASRFSASDGAARPSPSLAEGHTGLRTVGEYVRELKPLLPAAAFEPARSRLFWLPVQLAVIALSGSLVLALLAKGGEPWIWFLLPLLSLVIGGSLAGMVFLGHETLHGAVVRQRHLRYLVGSLTFLPFVVSPRLWTAWHNRVHHGNANRAGSDPDAYPTLEEHQGDLAVRIATDWFGMGRRRWLGLSTLFIGFSVQSLHMLWVSRKRGYLTPREHRFAVAETAFAAAIWVAIGFLLGPLAFVFACLIPWLVANAVVMAYIITNHSLSPLTAVNDPLANSLTVPVPPVVEFVTLGFGFQVEHHMFPWMSSRHAPLVRDLVLERWPEKYQSMPLHRALLSVHRTPRVYADDRTLIDPSTGETAPTLNPG